MLITRIGEDSVQSHSQSFLQELKDKKFIYIESAVNSLKRRSSESLLKHEPQIYECVLVDTSNFTLEDIREALETRLSYPTAFYPEYSDLLSFLQSVKKKPNAENTDRIVEGIKSAFQNFDILERFLRSRSNGHSNKTIH